VRSPKPAAPITVQLELARTTLTAGTPLKGVALFTNTTAHSITVDQCALDGWLAVGLVNEKISFEPVSPAIACAPSVRLAPGADRFKITIATIYLSCVPPSISEGSTSITCTPYGPPPLPAGRYRTKIVVTGLPTTTQLPPPTTVTLLAPTG
jgi:hypothetical protein